MNMMQSLPLSQISIDDAFWNKYISLVDDVIIPFQWELINDNVPGAEKSYCMHNFMVAAKMKDGEHKGMLFQDTDVAKWLEAVAFSLSCKKDEKLEQLADKAIDIIAAAQCESGYINTYYTIKNQPHFSNLFEGHELYTAGHLIEAAVAYYEATGKRKFLEVMCKFADHICDCFGKEDGKIKGYPGHPEIELALVKLYRVTGEKRYLELSHFFVKERGVEPQYFLSEDCIKNNNYCFPEFADFDLDYCQAHIDLSSQTTAEGHAVRALYLYCAMADLAYEYNDSVMLEQCEKLFDNIVDKRMYVTGSIGSAAYGERFTTDYDLPNSTNYSETCATIGLAMFANRMLQITQNAKYADIVELALYNTLLSGIALDGKHFFYVNPLEVLPQIAEKNPTMRHVEVNRKKWYSVACCPPNIARTLASLGNYAYAKQDEKLFVNLFVSSCISTEFGGMKTEFKVETNYPFDSCVKLEYTSIEKVSFTLALRVPSFSKTSYVTINSKEVMCEIINGYLMLNREWNCGDVVEFNMNIKPMFIRSNPNVRENIGKVCVKKGPVIYCAEQIDNGKNIFNFIVDTSKKIEEFDDKEHILKIHGCKIQLLKESQMLYTNEKRDYVEDSLILTPYCHWNNRGTGEMLVWLHEQFV